jgi:predicted nucleic acid-binding protein
MSVHRKRIDLDRVARFAGDLAALPIRIEPPYSPSAWNLVVQAATAHNLTVYDAAYLELAQRTRLPLATLDGGLRKAAEAGGAPLVEEA